MPPSQRVEEATRSLLEDHPDLEATLADLLERDAETEWEFDDVSLDSGRFGELVSTELVESTDAGNYQLTDRAAIARVVDGATVDDQAAGGSTQAAESGAGVSLPSFRNVNITFPAVDRGAAALVAVGLFTLVLARSLYFSRVFREGHVVSPANDPYYYRYWQEQMLALSEGPTDLSMLSTIGEETSSRPLTHTFNWWFGELVGAPTVAAWAPILVTVFLGIVVYLLAMELLANRRIAIAAVLLLALTPLHVVYTSLGFLEHRAYQYLFLALLVYALVWLAHDLRRRVDSNGPEAAGRAHATDHRVWVVVGCLGLAVAASAHSWGGSPLTFIPVALYLAFRGGADMKAGLQPYFSMAPTVAGIGLGSVLAWVMHSQFAWHESIAATVPLVVTVGGVFVALAATSWKRYGLPATYFVGVEAVIGVVGLVLYQFLRPDHVDRLRDRSEQLFGREGATETETLFSTDGFIIFEPMAQLGFHFFLALVPLGVATWYVTREYEPGWLCLVCFTWFYLVLATIQIRFAGQLAIFIAILGAVALVYILGAMELTRKPTIFGREKAQRPGLDDRDEPDATGDPDPITLPDPKIGAYIVAILVFVLLMNLVFVPSLLGNIYYSDDHFGATMAVADHLESTDHDQPDFVLSHWGENRMHNYFISGESRGYGYAAGNHDEFLVDENADDWYSSFSGRVGYIVITEREVRYAPVYVTLFEEFGAGDDAVGHYQLLYSTDDVRAFTVVEGAQIQTTGEANETVTAETDVETAGESFAYERSETANPDGNVSIRVAYPGEYSIGNETVAVSEVDVYEGESVSLDR